MIIDTSQLEPGNILGGKRLSSADGHQIYNGLDCCLTLEVFEEIGRSAEHDKAVWSGIYSFERALQAPYLEIIQRGFLVDELGRRQAAEELRGRIAILEAQLNDLAGAVWTKGLNSRSPLQLKKFFFEELRLPEVWIRQKGESKLSVNREALEKLDDYVFARPFTQHILRLRDLAKQLEVFETGIDPDGRFRAGYNIAGTETGRPSSSENAFGTARNAQNIAPGLRYIFTADRGMKMGVIDLEQVEARDVGFFCGCLFDDWSFLDNCESGDLHTNNCKLIWPGLPWTGEPRADRALADGQFYRDFSYRDMSKRGGHLTNYFGTAWTMAKSLKIPIADAEEFQARYCRGRGMDLAKGLTEISPAFPAIPQWWQWTAQQLQTTQTLVTPFGRRRHFFGRPGDDTTLREAIAYLPQSTTADRMNLGLWRVWRYEPRVELLAQTYDSITFQYRESEDEREIIGRILELLQVQLVAPNGRKYIVPGEAKVGWNWGSAVTLEDQEKARKAGKKVPRLNPEGLVKFKLGSKDSRKRAIGLGRAMA